MLTAYYIGCDAPDGDGYCMAATITNADYSIVYQWARERGWTEQDGLHICPAHSGTNA